jgi:hypothetical protein
VNTITIRNQPPWDGTYEFGELDMFTVREWGWLKRFANIHPATLVDALRNADAELVAVIAVIGLHRAGRINPDDAPRVFERFGDGPMATSFDLDFGAAEEGGDAVGPPPPSSTTKSGSSGDSSPTSSETSPSPPNGSGSPPSATSLYAPVTWGT